MTSSVKNEITFKQGWVWRHGFDCPWVTGPGFPIVCWNLNRAFSWEQCSGFLGECVPVLSLFPSLACSLSNSESAFPSISLSLPFEWSALGIKSNFLISEKHLPYFHHLKCTSEDVRGLFWVLHIGGSFAAEGGAGGVFHIAQDGQTFVCRGVHIMFLSVTHRPKWSPLSQRP